MPSLIPAELADISILNQISFESKAHWGYPDAWLKAWKEDLKITEEDVQNHAIYTLRERDKILGFCMIIKETDYYEVEHLWIKPAFIGKGYGKYLLNESLHLTVPQKSRVVVLADPNAEAFYAHLGFKTYQQVASFPKGRFIPKMEKEFCVY